jgi:pimeloyl-ACP methyl ester carboxylesterase
MQRLVSTTGATVSYEKYGRGPALVLVHGSFSDHDTNWEFVRPILERQFTVHAVARRGRGETDRIEGHTLEEESLDVAALIRTIGPRSDDHGTRDVRPGGVALPACVGACPAVGAAMTAATGKVDRLQRAEPAMMTLEPMLPRSAAK